MVEARVIELAQTEWTSPVLYVHKKLDTTSLRRLLETEFSHSKRFLTFERIKI